MNYEYIEWTRTLDKDPDLKSYGLGLCEEAGEVAGKLKKLYRDDKGQMTPERQEQIKLELGDVLYYIARICDAVDLTFQEVELANRFKLNERNRKGTIHGEGDNR